MFNLTINSSRFMSNFSRDYYTNSNWALTVVRPPNDEHAQIIVEGVKEENGHPQPFMRYAHLTSSKKNERHPDQHNHPGRTIRAGVGVVKENEVSQIDYSLKSKTLLVSAEKVEAMWAEIREYRDDPENRPIIYAATNLSRQRMIVLTKQRFMSQLRDADKDLFYQMYKVTEKENFLVGNFAVDALKFTNKILEKNRHKKIFIGMQKILNNFARALGNNVENDEQHDEDKEREVLRLSTAVVVERGVVDQKLLTNDINYQLISRYIDKERYQQSYEKWKKQCKYLSKNCPVTNETYAITALALFMMKNPIYVQAQYIHPVNCIKWIKNLINLKFNCQFKDHVFDSVVHSPTYDIAANKPSRRVMLFMVTRAATVPPSVYQIAENPLTLEFNFPEFEDEKGLKVKFKIRDSRHLEASVKNNKYLVELPSDSLTLQAEEKDLEGGLVELVLHQV